jgi:biopolymer transport protein ExbB
VNAILEALHAGGPLMIPLAVLCLAISFWVASLYPRLRRATRSVPALLGCVSGGRSRQEALSAIREAGGRHPGPLGRILAFALEGDYAEGEIRTRIREARRSETARFSREARLLEGLVAAAPLLGLLGTVKGMIETFWGLSVRGGGAMELFSSGISEALLTTQMGLIVAVPGLIGIHAVLRRLSELQNAIDQAESRLVLHGLNGGSK